MGRKRTVEEDKQLKRASAEERRLQIIQAAMQCFQRKGYENTTIDDIAAGASFGGPGLGLFFFLRKNAITSLLLPEHVRYFG